MTYRELINKSKLKFNIFEDNDIYLLIYHFSNKVKSKMELILHFEDNIDFDYQLIFKAIEENVNNSRPIEYIVGYVNFCSLTLMVNENVLIPRKETELLVDDLINTFDKSKYHNIIDLCSGSGCIGLTIKKFFPNSNVTLLEKYKKTLNVLKKNIKLTNLNVELIEDDLIHFLKHNNKKYDLVISNPPYVSYDYKISDDCKHEPHSALFAEDEGLFYIKKLIDYHNSILSDNGMMIVEIGYDQSNKLREYLKEKNIKYFFKKDFNNIERFLVIEN